MKIRPYQKKDFRYVQDICVASSKHAGDDNPTTRATLTAMYCDYYLDNQSDYCYVAVDEQDIPVGYVLCSVDRGDYEESMTELYLPLVRKLSSSDYFHWISEIKVTGRYVRQGYLAHMHVNVLEDYQRQGIGSELVNTLENKLREMYVEGVYLICGEKQEGARAFCEKMGYEDIDFLSGTVVYGKKFYTEE